MKITVKTLDSLDYQFDAQSDWTVLQFKESIQSTVGVAPDEQRLIFCGRVLQNDKNLSEYDCDGKVIHLVRRPPPSADNLNRNSSTNDSTSNPGDTSSVRTNSANIRLGDDNGIIFRTMTLGANGNLMADLVRHQIMSLQQAFQTRPFSDAPDPVNGSDRRTIGEVDRRLSNLSRLIRFTTVLVAECQNRIDSITQGSAANSRPVLNAASSHSDLSRNIADQANEPENQTSHTNQDDTSDTLSNQNQNNHESTLHTRTPAPDNMNRSSSTSRLSNDTGAEPSGQRTSQTLVHRYETLLGQANRLQNQVQSLMNWYREIVEMSHRGGLVVANQANDSMRAGQSHRDTESIDSSQTTATSQDQSSRPLSNMVLREARILSQHLPRIMHSLSHVLHALSDFSVDVTTGRLVALQQTTGLGMPTGIPTRARDTTRRSSRPDNARSAQQRENTTNQADAETTEHVVDSTFTITATTVEGESVSGSRPQSGATVIVTLEPSPTGVYEAIPITIPLPVLNSNDVHLSFFQPERATSTQDSSRDSSTSEQRTSDAQQTASRQDQPQSASTQTTATTRPVGVLSSRIPPPFDSYLMCCSPHAHYQSERTRNRSEQPVGAMTPAPRLQFRMPRTQMASVVEPAQSHTQGQPSQSGPQNPNAGLTEVVNNILESIFRPPDQATTQASNASTNNQSRVEQSNQVDPNPIMNMIPELAFSAASQILDGVFGLQRQPAAQQPARERSQNPVMMDIDIDDSSSSRPDSQYQDASEVPINPQTHATQKSTSNDPLQSSSRLDVASRGSTSTIRQLASSGQRVDYNREQLSSLIQDHPDWWPIIEADIQVMEQQSSDNPQYFSDAYLSSIPCKKRRLLSATPDRVPILQPTPSQAIRHLLQKAMAQSNIVISDNEPVLTSVADDPELQVAYEEYVKSAVGARLKVDCDYNQEKFENSSKYYNL